MLTVSAHPHDNKLRLFNNFLTVVVVVFGIYLIAAPFAPRFIFWWQSHHDSLHGYKYQSNLTKDSPESSQNGRLPKPPNRHLLVPAMHLDGKVFEGLYTNTLDEGIWHRPYTSTPPKGGNTVLVAHRFTYTGLGIFYNLDKVQLGDRFALFWDGREYDYQVSQIKIVQPTAIEIENNTKDPIVTLYTCTPMWTARLRLVVIGKLIANTQI